MKSAIICFIGTDGAGKSTLIAELKKKLESQQHRVSIAYFGWKPFLPTTKLLSLLLKKSNYRIADKMNSKSDEKNKFSLIQELMLSYYCLEYLSRYLFQLRLPLIFSRKKKIILVDRYFYDMYAHYHYANQSLIFPTLLKLMPKPDLTVFLDVDVNTAKQRKPEMDLQLLHKHHQRYLQLSQLLNAKTINTDQEIENSVQQILELTKEELKRKGALS